MSICPIRWWFYLRWLLTGIKSYIDFQVTSFQVGDDMVLVRFRDGFPSGNVLASVTMLIRNDESQLRCLVNRWLRASPVKTTVLSDRNVFCQLQQTRELLMTHEGCSWPQLFHSTARVKCEIVHKTISEPSHSDILRSTSHISFTRLLILLCSQRFHQRLTKSIVCDMSHAQAWKTTKQMPATDSLFSLLKIVWGMIHWMSPHVKRRRWVCDATHWHKHEPDR